MTIQVSQGTPLEGDTPWVNHDGELKAGSLAQRLDRTLYFSADAVRYQSNCWDETTPAAFGGIHIANKREIAQCVSAVIDLHGSFPGSFLVRENPEFAFALSFSRVHIVPTRPGGEDFHGKNLSIIPPLRGIPFSYSFQSPKAAVESFSPMVMGSIDALGVVFSQDSEANAQREILDPTILPNDDERMFKDDGTLFSRSICQRLKTIGSRWELDLQVDYFPPEPMNGGFFEEDTTIERIRLSLPIENFEFMTPMEIVLPETISTELRVIRPPTPGAPPQVNLLSWHAPETASSLWGLPPSVNLVRFLDSYITGCGVTLGTLFVTREEYESNLPDEDEPEW